MSAITLAALPVGLAVAIMRYRLYDIDRIISSPLAYAIVTGLLVGAYAGLVLLATAGAVGHSPTVADGQRRCSPPRPLFAPVRRQSSGSWTADSTGPATTPSRR